MWGKQLGSYMSLLAQSLARLNVTQCSIPGAMCNNRYAQTWAGVLQLEVLVRELCAIDGLATSAISCCEVSALDIAAASNFGPGL